METLTDMVVGSSSRSSSVSASGESSVPWRRNTSAARSSQKASTTSTRNTLGRFPLVGINTFVDPTTTADDWEPPTVELRRSTNAEKDDQNVSRAFQGRNKDQAAEALARLQAVAINGGNVFGELMSTVRVASRTDHRSTVRGRWRISPESVGAGDTLRLADLCEGHREPREKMGHSLAEVLDEVRKPCSIEQHGSRRAATA